MSKKNENSVRAVDLVNDVVLMGRSYEDMASISVDIALERLLKN